MKKREIKPALEGFKKVNMPKIEDKDFRNKLIAVHLQLLRDGRKYNEKVEDLEAAYLAPIQERADELQKVAAQFDAETDTEKRAALLKKLNSYNDVGEARVAFSREVEKLGKQPVKVAPLSLQKFTEEYMKQDYSAEVMEKVFPVFEDDAEEAPAERKKPAKK